MTNTTALKITENEWFLLLAAQLWAGHCVVLIWILEIKWLPLSLNLLAHMLFCIFISPGHFLLYTLLHHTKETVIISPHMLTLCTCEKTCKWSFSFLHSTQCQTEKVKTDLTNWCWYFRRSTVNNTVRKILPQKDQKCMAHVHLRVVQLHFPV